MKLKNKTSHPRHRNNLKRSFLPGMGDPNHNLGSRRRMQARASSMINRTMENLLGTLPSGMNDMGPRPGRIKGARSDRALPSKFARAHEPQADGKLFQDHKGRIYRWQNGTARRVQN